MEEKQKDIINMGHIKNSLAPFVICATILIATIAACLTTTVILSWNDEVNQDDELLNVEQAEEEAPTIKQITSMEIPGIYGDFTSKVDIAKINPTVASDPTSIAYINEHNESNEPLLSRYFGLVRDGRFIEQISILTPCYSVSDYTIDKKGTLKKADGTSAKNNDTMSSPNQYATYGAFVCQSDIVEIPINLPDGMKVRPDLGSAYNGRIDAENGKLYLDIAWSILADGTDVYYSSSDYDGYKWTIQDANNKTVRIYLVKLVPMLADSQLAFLNEWKSRIDANR